jgi:LysM repeat protein
MYPKLILLVAGIIVTTFLPAQNGELIVQGVAPKNYLDHSVAAKENFYSIGRLYNVAPKDLAVYNGVTVEKVISVGQKLKIPLSKTNFTSELRTPGKDDIHVPLFYFVKEHEGLYRIAVNNGLPMPRLKEMNDLVKDDISTGKKLMVGYLLLKTTPEAEARFGKAKNNVSFEPPVIVKEPVKKTEEVKKDIPPPVRDYAEMPKREDKPKEEQPVKQPKAPTPPVEEVKTTPAQGSQGEGYFKSDFQKMSSYGRTIKSNSGLSAIFKTGSGWQDGKYYALMDGVEPGSIIQVTNTANGKSIYAKVLGEMQELKQNHGLTIRISNAAASALNATTEKFDVAVKF